MNKERNATVAAEMLQKNKKANPEHKESSIVAFYETEVWDLVMRAVNNHLNYAYIKVPTHEVDIIGLIIYLHKQGFSSSSPEHNILRVSWPDLPV